MTKQNETSMQQPSRLQILNRLLKYTFKTAPAALIVAMISVVISAGATVYGSLFIQQLIDRYITPMLHEKVPNFTPLVHGMLLMAGIYLIGVIANYLMTILMMWLAQEVQKSIRDQMFSHMQYLPIAYFDQNEYGDIMSCYTNDIDTLMQLISQSIPQFVNSVLSLTFVIIAMFSLSWQLTIFSFLVFGLSYGVVRYLTINSGKYFSLQQAKLGEMNGFNEEMLNGLKVIKVFSHEADAKRDFEKYNDELREASGKANLFSTILFPIMGNMGNLLYVLIALVGGGLSAIGKMPLTVGALASFLQLSKSFSQPIMQISQQLNSIVMAIAGAGRIFNLLDEPVEVNEGKIEIAPNEKIQSSWNWLVPTNDGQVKEPVRGHIQFEHVNFSYSPEREILHDISIDAKPGMKIALVGETGAGKTTISNMINRFYEIDSGKILYDGLNIREIDKHALRQSVSIVLQETHLFTGTVMENIRFGNLNASDDQVYQAARLSHADEFIHELDHGYDTVINGDGGDLSQGQMQLLSIARAMIADRPVMILDEATSSIDTRTERMVQAGMDNLLAGRTSFVIAHRLSTIVNSDLILVLDHGQIIEAGSHDELLKQKGFYYELYTGKKELD
ncbi:MAG: ABC transporter ATP-binding protein/permease [Lactobacillus sp.]|jgi:ATP-binding cassette subfamily B protein|nr:ABC transporter ATP-binding protein/permease [Lactobacillus sp.]MCH3905595.1 ABC transporter ATP-binding protein/permease [Lactobacillus sp.]MCI1884194.1 ABC transporter ATP-binding protein/permease [Lactobacillus sp.]MCI1916538.1 ABC transporter ATP-binding protein/permease [Lactobacillus sp.]MCI1943040.1 ABC transporter ATP-binding protein/permease [Lactobacillus sp.]